MVTAVKTKRVKKVSARGVVNKAEEIRKAAKALGGRKVRPKDVIAALDAKGVTVSSPQVSSTLKAAGYRRIRRTKASGSPTTKSTLATANLSIEHLLAAKVLVAKVGSVEAAKKALDAFAKLA